MIQAGNRSKKGQTALPTGLAAPLAGASQAPMQVNALGGACFQATLTKVKKATSTQCTATR